MNSSSGTYADSPALQLKMNFMPEHRVAQRRGIVFDFLNFHLLCLKIGKFLFLAFHDGLRFIDLAAKIEIFLLRAIQLRAVIRNVLFSRRNGRGQRHTPRRSRSDFPLHVGQLLLRAAGIVFDFRGATLSADSSACDASSSDAAIDGPFCTRMPDHHHQDDQNADNVDGDVEERIRAGDSWTSVCSMMVRCPSSVVRCY